MKVRFLAEAELEFDDAVAWYDLQRVGLGRDFAVAVRDGVSRITQFPQGWHPLTPDIRRYRLSRFPYGLVYAPLADEILIIAVMHLHRQPSYWAGRLG